MNVCIPRMALLNFDSNIYIYLYIIRIVYYEFVMITIGVRVITIRTRRTDFEKLTSGPRVRSKFFQLFFPIPVGSFVKRDPSITRAAKRFTGTEFGLLLNVRRTCRVYFTSRRDGSTRGRSVARYEIGDVCTACVRSLSSVCRDLDGDRFLFVFAFFETDFDPFATQTQLGVYAYD